MNVITVAAGSGRGGSTLVSQLLGQRAGFYNVSELRQLWIHHELGYLCSCGEKISDCPLWSDLSDTIAGSLDMDTADWVAKLAAISRDRWRVRSEDQHLVTESLRQLVDLLGDRTGSDTLIESSKMPSFLAQLAIATPTDFVHLIRDSRAVAFSWTKAKKRSYAGGEEMRTRSVLVSAILWSKRHIGQEWVARRRGRHQTQVKYESLCADPERELARIWRDLKVSPGEDRPAGDATVHALAGNPGRFGKPITEITLDDAWRTSMRKSDIVLVSLLTWPLQLRYGYRFGRLAGS